MGTPVLSEMSVAVDIAWADLVYSHYLFEGNELFMLLDTENQPFVNRRRERTGK
jgi:hypothetical protein